MINNNNKKLKCEYIKQFPVFISYDNFNSERNKCKKYHLFVHKNVNLDTVLF